MATKIEWTDVTWNPIAGCSLVSPGCQRCYAMRMAARLEAMGQKKYAGLTKKVNGRAVWTGKITTDDVALLAPLKWRKPRKVFVNSMSDLFHPDVPFEFVDKVFAVMLMGPQHSFQVLTKRPERMAAYVEYRASNPAHVCLPTDDVNVQFSQWVDQVAKRPGPMPQVWLGCSVENDEWAARRLPELGKIHDAGWTTFVSYEPALNRVDWRRYGPVMDWLIAGAESGPHARPAQTDWYRDARDFCQENGVKFFLKQHVEGGNKISLPLLDGREWAEFPEAREAVTP